MPLTISSSPTLQRTWGRTAPSSFTSPSPQVLGAAPGLNQSPVGEPQGLEQSRTALISVDIWQ